MSWRRLSLVLALLAPALAGCSGRPTLSDARDYLVEGDAARALFAARQAIHSAPAQDRTAIRRVAFRAALQAGWSQEAAREYQQLEGLEGPDDELLTALALGTLRLGSTSQDPLRRLRTVEILGVLGEDSATLPLLLSGVSDEEPEVRIAAVRAIAQVDPGRGLEQAQRVLEDPEPAVRAETLRAVATGVRAGRLDPTRGRQLARQVVRGDPAAEVRAAAVDVLASSAVPRDQETLQAALRDGSDWVVRASARALVDSDPRQAWEAWQAAGLPEVGELGACGQMLAFQAGQVGVEQARAALALPAYRPRLAAVQALAPAGAAALVPELTQLVAADPAAAVRTAALRALAGVDDPAARQAVHDALDHPQPDTRRQAFLLELARDALPPQELASLLADPDPAYLPDLVAALGRSPDERSLRALLAALDRADTARLALRALTHLTRPELREIFLSRLSDPDPRVRIAAGLGLIRCGLGEDRDVLVQALTDQEGAADVAAAGALLSIQRHEPLATSERGAP